MPRDAVPVPADNPGATAIPAYLEETYWWAYVHPKAVSFFERQWLVNAILWGNFPRLRNAALDALGERLEGQTLQVACVYGDFTLRLAERIAGDGRLDVVDVLPIQLKNLREKLPAGSPVREHLGNSATLDFADASYERTVLFFLLHEQPEHVRRATLAEAIRVTKPGGIVVIVDYHLPRRFHPLRYLFRPVLGVLEPFALDLWRSEIESWLPAQVDRSRIDKQTYYGGLYQKLVIRL